MIFTCSEHLKNAYSLYDIRLKNCLLINHLRQEYVDVTVIAENPKTEYTLKLIKVSTITYEKGKMNLCPKFHKHFLSEGNME